jgi:hypothetical protein
LQERAGLLGCHFEIALLWQIFSCAGFLNQFFNDSSEASHRLFDRRPIALSRGAKVSNVSASYLGNW